MIIPNSVISSEIVTNSSIVDEHIYNFIDMGISYDSDVDRAMQIIREEALKHPNFLDNRTREEIKQNVPPVVVRMVGHGDFSINLRAYVWAANNDNAFALGADLLYSVKKRFDNEGIEIPFPYRTIVFKKDIEAQSAENH